MAIDETISYNIVKKRTRVTKFQIDFPFGGELSARIHFETRKLLNDDSTYAVEDAGEISRGQAAMNDVQTMGGNNVTFQQWLNLGEKFFDAWYKIDHMPKFLAPDLNIASIVMTVPAVSVV